MVVDNKVAYVGGFNVGKEYIDLMKSLTLERYPSADLRQCGTGAPGAIYFRLELCGRREPVLRPELFRGSKPVRGISVICRLSAVVRIRRLSRSMIITCV